MKTFGLVVDFSLFFVFFFQPVVHCAMALLDGINGFICLNKIIQILNRLEPIFWLTLFHFILILLNSALREKRPYSDIFWSVFSPNAEKYGHGKIQKNSGYGHFSRSAECVIPSFAYPVVDLGTYQKFMMQSFSENS